MSVANAQTVATFDYTGDVQTWVVPTGVYEIDIFARGACGGGIGGEATGTLAVFPGAQLKVRVGGLGSSPFGVGGGGYNGGGDGSGLTESGGRGYGGGGASDVRFGGDDLSHRVIVAGGGGGLIASVQPTTQAGNGGGLTGGSSRSTIGQKPPAFIAATGGSQTQGGSENGSLGQGGSGPFEASWGGGGGGYYGGGAAAWVPGGGGSSYIGGVTNGTTTRAAFDVKCNLASPDAKEATVAFSYVIISNTAPTADAGDDQTDVASSATVTLDGTGSTDPDAGDTLSYAWTQTDSTGETVTLSDDTAAQPTFTAPTLGANDAAVTLTFSLVVTDDKSNSSTADTVDITVTPPATIASAPRSLVATPGDGTVSVAFTVPARDGGAAITDYEYQIDDGNWRSASTISSPVIVTGLTNGTEYSIKLRAVNAAGKGEASQSVTFKMGSPGSAFHEYQEQITQIITDDAVRSLRSSIASNDRMIKNARERFIDSQRQRQIDEGGIASRNNVAFDVDGTAQVSGTTLSTSGTFFGQTGNFDGTSRRLVFGDFDVQHDGDTGSSTATITGRVAWEWMTSDNTMLGYFIGGELAHSSIAGAFDGDQDRLGVTVGGYAVHQLSEQLYADGYFSLGAGRNNLDMANDVLALTSDYTTQTATIGGALSGVYEYGQFELRPELAFSYGHTWIGNVGFTGRAYGLVDDTLSLDAGDVSIANLTLRPEVIWALDGMTVADSNSQLSFAPRLICEQVKTVRTTENCGGGAEFGLSSQSDDGLSHAEFRVLVDRVGGTTRSSFVFNLERQF